MKNLKKLKPGDKVAILSPSFAAPGMWPHVYELGLKRLRQVFQLEPVEFPTTKKLGASKEERAADLIAAFEDHEIKAVIASIGGNDQVTYVKNLPPKPFVDNPKPFFGFSDNTHLANFLWLNGIPSYYGGSLFTQFAMEGKMDDYTTEYLKRALFESGEFEIKASSYCKDVGLDWNDPDNLTKERMTETNEGWLWDGNASAAGITWGGCLESIDEILRHNIQIPSLEDFQKIILLTETSEEMPDDSYVFRIYRALGERGILGKVKAILIGRPQTWDIAKQQNSAQREDHRKRQRENILNVIRQYNKNIPVVQNLNFGHTNPQIPFPYGRNARIDSKEKRIFVDF